MAGSNLDGNRYGPLVRVPELTGRLDDVTATRMRALAENPDADPEGVRREQRRIVANRKQGQAAERARRRSAVELLNRDVAAAVNLVTRRA